MTDYEIFTARIKDFEGELVRVIGALPEVKARYEAWWTPKAGGFVLGVDEATGQIGVYEFVGVPGAPLAKDIEWLERKHNEGNISEMTNFIIACIALILSAFVYRWLGSDDK